jgi:lipoprotein-releasing system permease protein
MALIIVLSVFNGFDDLIQTRFNSFDPDLRITKKEGKTFPYDSLKLKQLSRIPEIEVFSKIIEENVLLKYGERQYIATVKGVDANYSKTNGIDTMMVDGEFVLEEKGAPFAVIGQGVAYYLQVGLNFVNPIMVYVLRKDAPISANPRNAINQEFIYPSGVFSIEQERDMKYMIVPLRFAQKLLEDSLSLSAIEIKIKKGADSDLIKSKIHEIFDDSFTVKNRYEQQELFYRIMKYEKWAIFFILSFILIVASFNVIGSLAVLIIEKRNDIGILNSMGANKKTIQRIFQAEGLFISMSGAVLGLILGLFICWAQMHFGLLKLEGSGSFLIDAYPVSIRFIDVIAVFITVLLIGLLASKYTVKIVVQRYLLQHV